MSITLILTKYEISFKLNFQIKYINKKTFHYLIKLEKYTKLV